jgi:hypothetical protein
MPEAVFLNRSRDEGEWPEFRLNLAYMFHPIGAYVYKCVGAGRLIQD